MEYQLAQKFTIMDLQIFFWTAKSTKTKKSLSAEEQLESNAARQYSIKYTTAQLCGKNRITSLCYYR